MHDNKGQINIAFSRYAYSYDSFSDVQKTLGRALINASEKYITELSGPISILDIGCGTGTSTKLFQYKIKSKGIEIKELYGLDFSAPMIEQFKKAIPKAKVICEDMDRIGQANINKKFDLILSNASFQWSEDLDKLFCAISNLLKPRGLFCFSMFLRETLSELSNALYIELQRETPAIRFLSYKTVLGILMKDFDVLYSRELAQTKTFNSLMDMLREIKNTGTYSHGKIGVITRKQLKQIETRIREENKSLSATYKAGIFICRKRH